MLVANGFSIAPQATTRITIMDHAKKRKASALYSAYGEEQDATSSIRKPDLNKNAKAAEFFQNKYFFFPDVQELPNLEEKLGDQTVAQFFQKYQSASDMMDAVGCFGMKAVVSKFGEYWNEYHQKSTPEEKLNGERIALTNEDDLGDIDRMYIDGLSNANNRYTDAKGKRKKDIHLVLGSSGSGKTTYAVKVLASQESVAKVWESEPFFVVYYSLAATSLDADNIIAKTKKAIMQQCEMDQYKRLDINLCVILDEAGTLDKGTLDTLDRLQTFQAQMKDGLVLRKVRLVVAGTGYDELVAHVSSETEADKYDMRPWDTASYIKLVDVQMSDQSTFKKAMIFAIKSIPVIANLGTNPRVAHALFHHTRGPDFLALKEDRNSGCLASLINHVAHSYMAQNGLQKLDDDERRLVARCVLMELRNSWWSLDKKPTYSELGHNRKLLAVARSLVDQNYELSIDSLKRLDKSKPPIVVTPAITIVLFFMLGASSEALGGWRNLETVGALSFLQTAAIQEQDPGNLCNYKLKRIHTSVPATMYKNNFRVPRLGSTVAWINGDRAPFADFVMGTKLGQAKYVSDPSNPVKLDMFEECLKMGVLQDSVVPAVRKSTLLHRRGLLHALKHVYGKCTGGIYPSFAMSAAKAETRKLPAETGASQPIMKRWLYPADLLVGEDREPFEMVKCKIQLDSDTVQGCIQVENGETILLSERIGTWQVFFLTNANGFQLNLGSDDNLTVVRNEVDANGYCNNKQWIAWCNSNIEEGVTVHFLFAVES